MIPTAEVVRGNPDNVTIIVAEPATPEDITNNIQQIEIADLATTNEDNKAIQSLLQLRKEMFKFVWVILITSLCHFIFNPLSLIYFLVLLLNVLGLQNPKPTLNFIIIFFNISVIVMIFFSNMLISINLTNIYRDYIYKMFDSIRVMFIYFGILFISSTILSFMYVYLIHNYIRLSIYYNRLTPNQKTLLHTILSN